MSRNRKYLLGIFLIALSLFSCFQVFLNERRNVEVISNNHFTFNTSFIHITDDSNDLIMGDSSTVRIQIFELITSNPGIHFRSICRDMGKETGVVQYHVGVLAKFNKIEPFKDGRFMRYFPTNSTLYNDLGKSIVSAWNRPLARSLIVLMSDDKKKRFTLKYLSSLLGVSRQAISWHLKTLVERGVVDCEKVNGVNTYGLTADARATLGKLVDAEVLQV